MKVFIVGHTMFNDFAAEESVEGKWNSDDVFGQDLIEFAGRACYQSWSRPNPATADNAGYIANIIEMQHLSVLEHGTVSFYITGVSRSLTHELVRHRHFSFSQESQRFVKVARDNELESARFVLPPLLENDVEAYRILWLAWNNAIDAYEELLTYINTSVPDAKKKEAREAARAVLPNMTPTSIVVTGNHRTWREFITKRGVPHADAEIRNLALEILGQLKEIEPNVYADMSVGVVDGKNVVIFGSAE
jgi:thymidylate synthase (FAD)